MSCITMLHFFISHDLQQAALLNLDKTVRSMVKRLSVAPARSADISARADN